MSDKIRAKLDSLLRMTESNGCTEDEAATAMSLAASLAAKHGIDLDQLAKSTGAPKPKIVRVRKRDEMPIHQTFAARAAAYLVGVRCDVFSQGKAGFEFIGREDLCESAEQIMFWLFRQVEELYRQALDARANDLGRTLSKTERAEFRRTFKPACAERVEQRASNIADNLQSGRTNVQGHNALVVVHHFRTLNDEIEEFIYGPKKTPEELARIEAQWKQWRQEHLAREKAWREANPEEAKRRDREEAKRARREAKRVYKSRPLYATGSGTEAGRAAGDQVKLHKEVE